MRLPADADRDRVTRTTRLLDDREQSCRELVLRHVPRRLRRGGRRRASSCFRTAITWARSACAALIAEDGDSLSPDHVLVTAGAASALFIIATSLLGPKAHALDLRAELRDEPRDSPRHRRRRRDHRPSLRGRLAPRSRGDSRHGSGRTRGSSASPIRTTRRAARSREMSSTLSSRSSRAIRLRDFSSTRPIESWPTATLSPWRRPCRPACSPSRRCRRRTACRAFGSDG